MSDDFVTLNDELIEAGGSATDAAGKPAGWTREQLALLGVEWPPEKGWKWRLRGRRIPRATYDRFLALRGSSKKMVARAAAAAQPRLF